MHRLVAIIVTAAFCAMPSTASGQGDQAIVIRLSSAGVPLQAVPIYWADPGSTPVRMGQTSANGEYVVPRVDLGGHTSLMSRMFLADMAKRAKDEEKEKERQTILLSMEVCASYLNSRDGVDPLRAVLGGVEDALTCSSGCRCERHVSQVVIDSLPMISRTIYDFARVNPFFTPAALQAPAERGNDNRFEFDFRTGAMRATLEDLGVAGDQMANQLSELGYNTIETNVDDKAAGWTVGGGAKWKFTDRVAIQGDYQFKNPGPWTARVHGSRINVPGTPSNLVFDTNTRYDMTQSNLVISTPLIIGPITITPGLISAYVNGTAQYTSSLLGAPFGQTPTIQAASGNEQRVFSGWGWGWQMGGTLALGSHVEIGALYDRARVKDVIPVVGGSYVTLSDVNTNGIVGQLILRP